MANYDRKDIVDYEISLIKEYEKYGYQGSVRAGIVLSQRFEWFGELVGELSSGRGRNLFEEILKDTKIKLNYDIVKNFAYNQDKLNWALRNGQDNLGEDEQKIFNDVADERDLSWAVDQYLMGQYTLDMYAPNSSYYVEYKDQDKSKPARKNVTKEEVIIKEMKKGTLAEYLSKRTYLRVVKVQDEFIELILNNNPNYELLKECVFTLACSVETREKLILEFIKKCYISEVNSLSRRESITEDLEGNIYQGDKQEADKRCNKIMRAFLERGDYFSDYEAYMIFDEISSIKLHPYGLYNFMNFACNVEPSTVQLCIDEGIKNLKNVVTDDKKDFYIDKLLLNESEEKLKYLINAIEKNYTLEELQNKKLTYDRDKQAEVLEKYGHYYINDVLSRFDQRCDIVNKAFAEIVEKKQEELLNNQ